MRLHRRCSRLGPDRRVHGPDDDERAGERPRARPLAEEEHPGAIATSGFTYWCVTTSEIGAAQEPRVGREADERAGDDEVEPGGHRVGRERRAVELPGLAEGDAPSEEEPSGPHLVHDGHERVGGQAEAAERNDPSAHETVAAIITASPSAVEPTPRPGATTRASPRGRERAQARRAGGAVAGEDAHADDQQRHRPDDHRRDARVDASLRHVHHPVAEREQQRAGAALARLAALDPELVPRTARIARARRGDEEAASRREEQRHRVDDDLDREVGRAPDDVDDEERRPDVPHRSGHERETRDAPFL